MLTTSITLRIHNRQSNVFINGVNEITLVIEVKVLILSDVHGNYEALKTIFNSIGRFDEVLVLGDLVDYGPNPDLVIDFIRSSGAKIVKGNHDEAAGSGVDCRCGPELHDLSVYTRNKITYAKLSSNDLNYLRTLPTTLELNYLGKTFLLVHGNLESPLYGYTYPWLKNEELCSLFSTKKQFRLNARRGGCEDIPYDFIFIGHTHIPFYRSLQKLKVVNPGSVGQPRDGDFRASATLLDVDEESVKFIRIAYDVEKVIAELKLLIDDSKFLDMSIALLKYGKLL